MTRTRHHRAHAQTRLVLWAAVALLLSRLATSAFADPVAGVPAKAQVAVSSCPVGAAQVPDDYLGLSVEWGVVHDWFGPTPGGVPATVRLLRSLTAESGTGVLRIGGNSQDAYRWDPHGDPTRNTTFSGVITADMVSDLVAAARMTGWKLVVGLNLRDDRPDLAAGLTRALLEQDITHQVVAVELGNEPNGYFGSDVAGYLARVRRYVERLDADPVTRGVPLTGPALSNGASTDYVSAFTQAYSGREPFVTWHHYANRPTLTDLLAEDVQRTWTQRIGEVAVAAGSTPIRMGEGNSVGHGGLNRVSNAFGATAWLVDTLLTGAQAGLAGFNLHSWDQITTGRGQLVPYYTPLLVHGGVLEARPSTYALGLLRDLPGSRFCRTVAAPGSNEALKTWSLLSPDGRHLSIYTVNKGSVAGTVRIADALTALGSRHGELTRTTDPRGCQGTQGGLNGAQAAPSGELTWTPQPVDPDTSNVYSVTLEPCQSAVLTLPV